MFSSCVFSSLSTAVPNVGCLALGSNFLPTPPFYATLVRVSSLSFFFFFQEGRQGSPKMMSIGLHCRLVGRPGRTAALSKFLDYLKSKGEEVWVCKREDIARHWHATHPPQAAGTGGELPPATRVSTL